MLQDSLGSYNQDWMNKYTGNSKLVLRPKNTTHVSQILSYCNANEIAVVPQGGNTGLVGGSVPVHDEIILSMQSMNNIRAFDETSGIVECDAGCILENVDTFLAEKGFMMPLDLGAKGTCQIGGNVATNAGGLRVLRYGSLHGTVLALEIVKADGTVMNLGKSLRKDNTGYDLKQLFIGSEGTLGVITGVTMLTPSRPKSTQVAILGLDSYENVQRLFKAAKTDLEEILSAFEFFDRPCLDLVTKYIDNSRDPLSVNCPFYVLVETSGSNATHDSEKLNSFLEKVLESEIVADGVLAQDTSQISQFWNIRESIPEACFRQGGVFKYDLSVPVPKLYTLVTKMSAQLEKKRMLDVKAGPVTHVVGFGHIGDGNLHLNIMTTGRTAEIESAIEPFIYEQTQLYNGSISAEHGLGLMKAPYLAFSQSVESIQTMKDIKNLFDPKGILNPYKYFPKK